MISTNEFKNGISIVVDDTLYQIVDFQHIKPGKGGAFVRTRLKNMLTKAVMQQISKTIAVDHHLSIIRIQWM